MHCSQNEITTNVCIWEISCNLLALVEFHFRFNAPHQVPQVISSSKSQDVCSAHACNDQRKHKWEEMTWHLIDNFMHYKAINNRYCCLHKKLQSPLHLTERQPWLYQRTLSQCRTGERCTAWHTWVHTSASTHHVVSHASTNNAQFVVPCYILEDINKHGKGKGGKGVTWCSHRANRMEPRDKLSPCSWRLTNVTVGKWVGSGGTVGRGHVLSLCCAT